MPPRASRLQTEARLVDALGALLVEEGFTAVGVNAVCARAGVNKALLYRYFGGLDGLMEALASASDFWPSVDEVTGPADEFRALTAQQRIERFVPAYAAALEKRPRTLAILAWETVARNQLTAHLETVREDWSHALAERMMSPADGLAHPVDGPALGAILSGATHYLLLRKRHIRWYGGLDLHSEADQDRWLRMLVQMMTAVVVGPTSSDGSTHLKH